MAVTSHVLLKVGLTETKGSEVRVLAGTFYKMIIDKIIKKSGLLFLKNIEFEEKTLGRYFQKNKIDIGNGLKYFYVLLGPNTESPVHNHKNEDMEETHLLLFGSGKFIIYGEEEKEINLELGKFHRVFSTFDNAPNHKYIAGPEGSITLALEKHKTIS